jgi:hypothetical protein
MRNNNQSPDFDSEKSSDPSLTRSEFIQKVVKASALTGGILAAPRILDRFLVPPAYAATSTGCTNGDLTVGGNGTDFVVLGVASCATTDGGSGTICNAGADTTLACG